MATLINGNGNPAVYANQDADLIASICGDTTCIATVGSEFAATQEDANTIGLADGVIVTKEGRRIQLDAGYTDLFTIPTGTAGTTSYYIIGYKLTTGSDSKQTCETFVQKMNSSSETITEDTFRGGASDVYVSVYRVVQNGLNIQSINLLLPKLSNIGKLKSDLTKDLELSNNSINLSNYSSSSPYTATSDGYAYLLSPYGTGNNAVLKTASGVSGLGNNKSLKLINADNTTTQNDTLFIKKGMRIYGEVSGTGRVTFYPLA